MDALAMTGQPDVFIVRWAKKVRFWFYRALYWIGSFHPHGKIPVYTLRMVLGAFTILIVYAVCFMTAITISLFYPVLGTFLIGFLSMLFLITVVWVAIELRNVNRRHKEYIEQHARLEKEIAEIVRTVVQPDGGKHQDEISASQTNE